MKQDQIHRGAGPWLSAAGGLLLAACSTSWIDNALGLEPAAKRSVAAKPERSVGALANPPTRAARPAASPPGEALAALPSPTPPAAPAVKLVGLSRSQTAALLGPPASEKNVAPSRVWSYRVPQCSLDVYFYFDVGRNDFYALHYDTGGGAEAESADRCLRLVHDARVGR